MTGIRVDTGARLLVGSTLVTAPGAVVGPVAGRRLDGRERATARVLGARHLVQGLVLARWHGPRALAAGAAVVCLRAASMVAVAACSPRTRRAAAAADAALALCFAAAALAARRLAPRRLSGSA